MKHQEMIATLSYPIGLAVSKLIEAGETKGMTGEALLNEAMDAVKLELTTRKKDKTPAPKKKRTTKKKAPESTPIPPMPNPEEDNDDELDDLV